MYSANQRSPLAELLLQIDTQSPSLPTQQSVFQPSSTVFYSILQMYNSFKKQNEIRILQNKIYTLNINTDDETIYTHEELALKNNVTIGSLCQIHELTAEDIDSLLKIKDYLPVEYRRQIIVQIVNKIKNISIATNNLKLAANGFKKLLRSKQCLQSQVTQITQTNTNSQLKEYVQTQMIKTILSLKLEKDDFIYIGNFLFTLPNLNYQILNLIAHLYEKISQNQQFRTLSQVYSYISNKEQNHTNYEESNIIKLSTMIKICLPSHLEMLKQRVKQNKGSQIEGNRIVKLIEDEVCIKMNSDFSSLTDKVKDMIQFIFFAVYTSDQLWNDFILWRWKLPETCQGFVNNYKLPELASQILQQDHEKNKTNFIKTLAIIKLLLQNENQFQISQHFVRQILLSDAKKLIINKIIRKFVAVKTLIDSDYTYWDLIIQSKFEYIDVILEMFQFEQAHEFFRLILEQNSLRSTQLFGYLTDLYISKPLKFKQFLIRIDQSPNNRIFQFGEYSLLTFIGKKSDISMAVAIIRQLSCYTPSPYCILILTNFMSIFSEGSSLKYVKTQIIRTLNIILMNHKEKQLNSAFKKQLKDFGQKVGNPDAINIFEDVPEDVKNDLKLFYQENKE